MFKSSETEIFKLIKPFAESYPDVYETLSQAKPITCATTGTKFDAVPAPMAVIMDVRLSYLYVHNVRVNPIITTSSSPCLNYKQLENSAGIPSQSLPGLLVAHRPSSAFLVLKKWAGWVILVPRLTLKPRALGSLLRRLEIRFVIDALSLRGGEVIMRCQIFRRTTGAVIKIGGLPAMYDYEFFPQKVWSISYHMLDS
jgi:hypothetical protein